jgi:hypothetical protein
VRPAEQLMKATISALPSSAQAQAQLESELALILKYPAFARPRASSREAF